MKPSKVIKEMAKLIVNHGMGRLKQQLMDALMEEYGVDGMVFWKGPNGYVYCSEDSETPKIVVNDLWADRGFSKLDFDELVKCLGGLSTETYRVIYNGEVVRNLDEIKRFALTKKLADIK